MTVKANCGGLILDDVTLEDVNQIVTTKGSTPTTKFQAGCGKFFDASVFKLVNGVVTDIDNMGTVTATEVFCGGLVVDSGCFSITGGKLAFTNISGDCDITAYAIGDAEGEIDDDEIAVEVPSGTEVTSLVATFTLSANASAKVGTTAQVSGTTANDFTSPVEYVVTAQGGATKTYTVTVTVAE